MIALCQVEVNNIPETTEEWIVVRKNPETSELWYWGSWESKEQAREIAKFLDGILVRRVNE